MLSRPKGSKNKAKAPTADQGDVETDHNGNGAGHPAKEPLTDEQQQGLFEHHKGKYEKALASKKAADAALKNICKTAKGEGVSVADIKLAIDLEEDGGEERLREKIERQHRIARWLGLPVGSQPSFFDDEDRTPSVEKAEAEGKRAGMKGESCNPPGHLGMAQAQYWTAGWHAGQKVLADRIGQKHDQERAEDAAEFDGAAA